MRRWLIYIVLVLLVTPLSAQEDAFNLPAALYVLTNEGQVSRYGIGTEGVSRTTPDNEFVVDFGVAPDDNWLAYRTEGALVLYNYHSGERVTVDGAQADVPPVRGEGATIAWSPAGDAIATTTLSGGRVYFNTETELDASGDFTAVNLAEGPFVQVIWSPDGRYLAAEAEGQVWWLYRRENNSLILTSAITSSDGVAWYDETTVAFTPAEGGLRLMDLSEANAQSTLMDDTWIYHLPDMDEGGTLKVFGWQKGDTVPENFGRLIGLPANEPRVDNLSELSLELDGMRWIPGSELLMAFRGGALALVNPVTADGFTLPVANVVAYDWGPLPLPRTDSPAISAPLYFLAADATGLAQVWRLPGNGAPAETLTASDANILEFVVSANDEQIAYTTDSQLVLQPLNGAAPVPLVTEGRPQQPAFSPGGQQIAYVDNGIWIVPAGGGEPRQIIADETTEGFERHYLQPQFAPNVEALLVQVAREDITVPAVLDPNTGEVLEVALERRAQWLDDGRIVLYGSGLSIAGTGSLNQPAQFLPDFLPVQAVREVSTNRLQLALPEHFTGPVLLRTAVLDVTSGQLEAGPGGGFMVEPSFSPAGDFAAGYGYKASDEENPIPRGPLTVRNLETGVQTVLSSPAEVWQVSW